MLSLSNTNHQLDTYPTGRAKCMDFKMGEQRGVVRRAEGGGGEQRRGSLPQIVALQLNRALVQPRYTRFFAEDDTRIHSIAKEIPFTINQYVHTNLSRKGKNVIK